MMIAKKSSISTRWEISLMGTGFVLKFLYYLIMIDLPVFERLPVHTVALICKYSPQNIMLTTLELLD
jgi:hypothetical protein